MIVIAVSRSAVMFKWHIFRCSVACFMVVVLAASLTRASTSVYKQVYPDIEEESLHRFCDSRNETCPLFITLLMSFGGIYKSNGAIPGIQIALDEINRNSTMLPGYKLHYTLKDSNCSREVSLSSFYTQMFQPPVKLGVIGSGCSVATEPTAEAVYYFNLTQLSCISNSPALSNRVQYKTHFQLLASEIFMAYGFFGIVKKFGWQRVAIIAQDETLFTNVMDLVAEQLRAHNISYTKTLFSTKDGVMALGDRLFDPEARIFLLSMYHIHARELLCQAQQQNIRYPKYQFIGNGWYEDKWWVGDEETQEDLLREHQCSVADRESVLPFMLTVTLDESLKNYSKVVDSGINGSRFYENYDHLINTSTLEPRLEPLIYTQQCYDATWVLAHALNTTLTALIDNETLNEQFRQFNSDLGPNDRFGLHHFTYNNSAMLDMIFNSIRDIDFIGLTGHIRFSEDGVKKIQFVLVEQYRIDEENNTIKKMYVGLVDITNTSELIFSYEESVGDTNLWQHGEIPYDGVHKSAHVTIQTAVTVLYSMLALAGLVFSVVCLVFNFMARNSRLMKLSSPKLNYLILAGATILYINIFFFIIPTTNPSTVTVLCNITPWLSSIGSSLCFGTIIMKMGRIFYIFNNVMSTAVKKTIHDWMLAIGVVILVTIDVLILGVYSIVDRNNLDAVSVVNRERTQDEKGVLGIITNYYIYICDSSSWRITSIILNGIKVLLQIVALIFAFSIRKVNVKGLDDSQFVIAAVYFTSIFWAVIMVTSISLREYKNAAAIVYSTGFFISTTVILLLIFVPKMVTLYRDPKGEKIFKNVIPKCEIATDSQLKEKQELNRRTSLPDYLHSENAHQQRVEEFQLDLNVSQVLKATDPKSNDEFPVSRANRKPKKRINKGMTLSIFATSLQPTIKE